MENSMSLWEGIKKPVICDSENLRNISSTLLNSRTHLYDPVSTTARFTGYTEYS